MIFDITYLQFVLCFIASGFVVSQINRLMNVKHFYRDIDVIKEKYGKQFPDKDYTFLEGTVENKIVAILSIFTFDMNRFILNHDNMYELVTGSEKYDLSQENMKIMELSKNISCIWCDNAISDKFQWEEIEGDYEGVVPYGSVRCLECGATTPVTTLSRCLELLSNDSTEKEE